MNYHPIQGAPAVASEPDARHYQANRYADAVALATVRAYELMRPLRARQSESLYREYFQRARAEMLRKTAP